MDTEEIIKTLYENFNERNIDAVLLLMHDNVQWANGWKGGFVYGHEGIRNYWTAQWKEITPFVYPKSVMDIGQGKIEVIVHQVAHDKEGNLLFDGNIKHYFLVESGLVRKFEIEELNKQV